MAKSLLALALAAVLALAFMVPTTTLADGAAKTVYLVAEAEGPRSPLPGEKSAVNYTSLKLSLQNMANMFAQRNGCSPAELIEYSGWKDFENYVPEKGEPVYISCSPPTDEGELVASN